MCPSCTICTHEKVDEINKAIIAGSSYRHIASQYNVSYKAVHRHKDNHLPTTLLKAHEAEVVTQADGLLGDLIGLKSKALSLLDQAEVAGDLRAASSLIGQVRQVIETLADVQTSIIKQERELKQVEETPEQIAREMSDIELDKSMRKLIKRIHGIDVPPHPHLNYSD